MISAGEIVSSLEVTGIANIPNQVHHQVRSTKHHINLALIGTKYYRKVLMSR